MTLRKNRLSVESKRLLEHILANGPQNLFQLRPLTGELEGDLVKRLRNLRTGGWLEIVDDKPQLCWDICKAAIPFFQKGQVAKHASKGQPKPMGEMPLPRQINVMEGRYESAPFTPPRQGSMDFRAIASRGVRC